MPHHFKKYVGALAENCLRKSRHVGSVATKHHITTSQGMYRRIRKLPFQEKLRLFHSAWVSGPRRAIGRASQKFATISASMSEETTIHARPVPQARLVLLGHSGGPHHVRQRLLRALRIHVLRLACMQRLLRQAWEKPCSNIRGYSKDDQRTQSMLLRQEAA